MAETIGGRIRHAWNVFLGKDDLDTAYPKSYQSSYSYGSSRQDRVRPRYSAEKSIISSIYTRLSIDCADAILRHVRLNENGEYDSDMPSYLNECLTVAANIDQKARAFRQDIFQSLFDNGVIAIVPIDTTGNPLVEAYDIKTMRVGFITGWEPEQVTASVYNQKTGIREPISVPKALAAIVENPFYSVMNEPNSTLQRLQLKLNMLDSLDSQISSGKLDMIIQLPYVIKTEAKRDAAETRRKDIEIQLKNSQYGIAYTDGTERITQLNRPVENTLLPQITYLTEELYSHLGLTPEIMKGTADEKTMLNYLNRTVAPLVEAVAESMHATFLTKTARSQKQAIKYFRDPFKLVPVSQIAEIADKFTRNKIATSNELRSAIGWKPSKDPSADKLENSNMPQKSDESAGTPPAAPVADPFNQPSVQE